MRTTTVAVYPEAALHDASSPAWRFDALEPETRVERELGLIAHPGRAMVFHDAREVTLVATPFPLDVYALLRSRSGPEAYLVRAGRSVDAFAPGIVSWPDLDYTCVVELPHGAGPLVPGDVLRFG